MELGLYGFRFPKSTVRGMSVGLRSQSASGVCCGGCELTSPVVVVDGEGREDEVFVAFVASVAAGAGRPSAAPAVVVSIGELA